MPTLYRNGVAYQQNEMYPAYQWQKADAPGGPWVNIPGGVLKNYAPSPTAISQYFRRIAKQSPCCGSGNLSTSDVAAVLVNSNAAPSINAGGAFNTCPSSTINIGGSPAASGGLPPYTYLWDNGASPVASPAVNPVNNTIYTLIVTDALGCKSIDQAVVHTYQADAGPDVSRCGGSPVRIGAAPVPGLLGAAYSWAAAPADPTMSCTTCAQPVVNPSIVTVYTLTLAVPKSGGGTCFTTDAVTVTPVDGPVTSNFAGTDKTICSGSTASLGTPAEPGFTYTWAPGNFISYNGSSQTAFQPGNLGMPSPNPVIYYLNASKGTCTFTDEVIASAIEARAGIDGCGPRYVGEPDRTPSINETYSWTIVSGPGHFLGATNLPQVPVSASPGTPTIYQLTVTYNGNTCTDFVTVGSCGCGIHIEVVAPSKCPSFALSGGSVSLNASAAGIGINPATIIYTWSPAAGLSATNGSVVYLTDNVPRTYTLTVTSSIDPSFTCSETIDVNNPLWAVPVFTAQDVSICSGTPVSIGQAPVAGYSYDWGNVTTTGLNSYTISNPTATANATTNYYVAVTDVVSGCVKTDVATVTILNTPANAGPDYTVCSNAVIKLGTPALPNTTYAWSPAISPWQNGTDETDAQPQVLVATNLVFTVIATNAVTGCVTSDLMTVTVNNAPVINAPDKTICFGRPDTIGTAALAGVTYSWSPAAGLSCTNCAQPLASPAVTTNYTVVATFPGPGCTATDNVLVTVSNPSFSIPDISYCPSSGGFALAPTAPVGMSIYGWSPASQVTNAAIANPNTLTPAPGTASTYTLTVTNSNGCTASDNVTINPTITAPGSGSNRTMCLNANTTLGTATNLATDVWNIVSGPNTSTAQLSCVTCAQPVFTPTATGSYVLDVSRTIAGCTSNSTLNITVNEFSLAPMASPMVCENSCVQIGTAPQLGVQYFWTPASGLSNANIANPVACPGTSDKTYILLAIGLNGCEAMANTIVGVNPSQKPQVSIPPFVTCLGNTNIHFNPVVSPAGSYTYQWSPNNDGTLSDMYIENPEVYLTSSLSLKQYFLSVTNTTNGCSNSATADLTKLPCSILTVKLENFTAFEQGGLIKIDWKLSEEKTAANYSIEFSSDGINFKSIGTIAAINQGNYNFTHDSPVNGFNYYRLKVTEVNNKSFYSAIKKVLFEKESLLRVYPNPAQDYIKILPPPNMINKSGVIRIIGSNGNVVLQKSTNMMSQIETVNLSKLSDGKYIVQVISGNEVVNKIIEVIK